MYSVPNVILPFFGGYFIDKLGVRRMLLVFVSLVTAGQALFALGVSLHDRSLGVHDMKSWYVMFAGRVLFGLGGESMTVAQSTFIVEWFKVRIILTCFLCFLSSLSHTFTFVFILT